MDISKVLECCKKLAIEAGEAILEIYNQQKPVAVEYKTDKSPLTAADKAANKIIVSGLKAQFPECAILSEEQKDDKSRLDNPHCFVVDPLDGTKEFIKRNGQFTVNIALAEHGISVAGVIYVPVTKELYYAAKGIGAFLDIQGSIKQLHVSERTNDLRVVMSSSHGCTEMDDLIARHHLDNFVKMGSSLKGCLIAKGEAEIYYRFNPTMEWDTAAMQCIAEEAGAVFRQMDDSDMRYNRENSKNEKGFYIINRKENRIR